MYETFMPVEQDPCQLIQIQQAACVLTPRCVLQVRPLYSSQMHMMGLEEWMRFQEWGKRSTQLCKDQLKCHLLYVTFPNSLPTCTPLHLLHVKMNHSLSTFIACTPPISLALKPQILYSFYCHEIGGRIN